MELGITVYHMVLPKPGVKEECRTGNLPSLLQNGSNISVCFCFTVESAVKRTPSLGLKPADSKNRDI